MSENNNMKKTLIKVWKLELSRDFVLFMMAFGVLIAILLYSPNEIRNVLIEIRNIGQQILNLGEQNQDLAEQGVNNTDKIINDSAKRFELNSNRTISILTELRGLVNTSETDRKALGEDFVNVFFTYMMDIRKDIDLILEKENITKVDGAVSYNGTHLITDRGDTLQFPFKA